MPYLCHLHSGRFWYHATFQSWQKADRFYKYDPNMQDLQEVGGKFTFFLTGGQKISLGKKSLQIQAKSFDFILNPVGKCNISKRKQTSGKKTCRTLFKTPKRNCMRNLERF